MVTSGLSLKWLSSMPPASTTSCSRSTDSSLIQETSLPFDDAGGATADIMATFRPEDYPHLVEMATEHIMKPGYDFGAGFEFGLDLILDGLEQSRCRAVPPHLP